MDDKNFKQFLTDNFSQFKEHWLNTWEQKRLPNTLIVSASDGYKRAKVLTFEFEPDDLMNGNGENILALLHKKVDWSQKKFENPLKWLRLEWIRREESTNWLSFNTDLKRYKRNYYRSGIAYKGNTKPWCLLTEMELNANACLYYGTDVSYSKVNPTNLETYIRSRHSSKNLPSFTDDMEIVVFSTSGIFFDLQKQEVHKLCTKSRHHGHRIVPPLNKDSASEYIKNITQYLSRQVLVDGKFEYGHFPCFGRTINFYNNLRHASSIYALIEGYEFCRSLNPNDITLEYIRNQIEKALVYLKDNVIRHYPNNIAYALEINNEIKLGANAVAILALVKYIQVFEDSKFNKEFLSIADKLANGILKMQKDNGQFVHILDGNTLELISESRVIYYDGEAAFGLMRLYGVTRDERLINCVEKAFDYFIRAGHSGAHDHWLSYCSNEMVIYRPERKYFQFAVNNVKGYTDFIKSRITTFPTLLELSMAFHKMLLKLDEHPEYQDVLDGFNVQEFYTALHTRANYLINGYLFPEMAMYFKLPDTILHGCFIRHHSFRVRIDDVEHYLSGLIAYHQLLKNLNYPKLSNDHKVNASIKNTPPLEDIQKIKDTPLKPINKTNNNSSTVAWGGDVNLGRRQHYMTAKIGHDNVLNIPFLKDADFTLVNLECVVSVKGEQGRNKGEGGPYYYRARPEMVEVLRHAGVDAVACANNHSGDYGPDALLQQREILQAAGIVSIGTGVTVDEAFAPIYHQLPNGVRLAIFSVDATIKYFAVNDDIAGAAYIDPKAHQRWISTYAPLFERAKQKADIVLVAIHWGANGRPEPDKDEFEIGHRLIDVGADAILGASAHQLQGIEVYKGKPIIHDAGDLLFDAMVANPKPSGVFQLEISQLGIEVVRFYPVEVGFGQTQVVSGQKAIDASRNFAIICMAMGSEVDLHTDGSLSISVTPSLSEKVAVPDKVDTKLTSLNVNNKIEYSAWLAQERTDLVMEEVPKDARITPISFGALQLVGIRTKPYFFNRRRMLWIESFWQTSELLDDDIRIHFRAKPTFSASKMKPWGIGTEHDPCDWLIPTSQWKTGKIYRDFYGLRPPYFNTWENGELQLEVSVNTSNERHRFISLPFYYLLHRPMVKYADNLPARLRYRQAFPDNIYPNSSSHLHHDQNIKPTQVLGTWNAEQLKAITGGQWLVEPPKGWYVDSIVAGKKHIGIASGRVMLVANTNENRAEHENNKYSSSYDRHNQIIECQDDLVGAIVQYPVKGLRPDLPILQVKDPIKSWIEIGIAARTRFARPLIVVTGSVGKSSVCNMLNTMLGTKDILVSMDNYNSRVGTLGTLASLSLNHKAAIIEVAISALNMNRGPVTGFIQPDVAVITNIGPAHIDKFKTEENIAIQKSKIFIGMSPGSLAVICRDIEYYSIIEQLALNQQLKIVSYGEHEASNIRLINDNLGTNHKGQYNKAQISIDGQLYNLELNAGGKHMVINAMATLAVASYFKIPIESAINNLKNFQPVEGRGNITSITYKGKNIRLYDEAYNANPLSMQAALKTFDELNVLSSNKVIIIGDMLELGENSLQYHLELANLVNSIECREVLLVGKLSKSLASVLNKSSRGVHHYDTTEQLSKHLDDYIRPGDSVLIKASNGIGLAKLFK